MEQFIEGCLSWPALPATTLLACVVLYWVLALLGAVDLDFLSIDLDFDMDVEVGGDVSVLQVGFVPVKWLNIGSVPTMLWVSIFSLSGWFIGRIWGSPEPHPHFEWTSDTVAIIRDFGVAAFVTKAATQPLRGRFEPEEPNRAEDLLGRICQVTTSEVTSTFGEAELPTDGAPLKLKVRSRDAAIGRGDSVLIVDFQAEGNLYFVTPFDAPDLS
ncbi:MAG: hypothetical protein NXI04_14295 [Planctomycetaceae bacterium]|nr:hypothetical protein [Planctomycetaceae bacterium]